MMPIRMVMRNNGWRTNHKSLVVARSRQKWQCPYKKLVALPKNIPLNGGQQFARNIAVIHVVTGLYAVPGKSDNIIAQYATVFAVSHG
jgi:hypothetical protein